MARPNHHPQNGKTFEPPRAPWLRQELTGELREVRYVAVGVAEDLLIFNGEQPAMIF